MNDNKILKKRNEISSQDKWRLHEIYENEALWEEDFICFKKESLKLKDFQGKLQDKEEILKYLEFNEKVSRQVEKLYVFAHMKSDEDTQNQKFQGLMNRIDSFMAEFGSYNAFFTPELLSLKESFIQDLIDNDERFKIYEFGRIFETCEAEFRRSQKGYQKIKKCFD